MKKRLFLPFIALTVACGTSQDEANNSTEKEVVHTAFDLSNLDTTVAPCTDFYQYAIGGWLKNNPVPATESRWGSFNVIVESNNIKLKSILTEYSASEGKQGSKEQLIGDFYTSLMDSVLANKLGAGPIMPLLNEIDEINSIDELIKKSAEFRKIGVSTLFGVYVGQDDKQSDQYITHLYQSGLGLPDQAYYVKTDDKSKAIQEAYTAHIGKMLQFAGIENADMMAQEVYMVEKALAEISMDRVERRDPNKTYNKMTLKELNKLGANINWENYFSTVGLKSIDNLVVSQPLFISGTSKLLKSIDMNKLKNYFKWSVINSLASNLSSDFVNQNFDFYSRTLSGTKEMKPRWKTALGKVNGAIGQLLGQAFVERHFSEESKLELDRMVENLRVVFRERINNLSWMTNETKEKALAKLNSFNKKIGYPDKWRDYSALVIKKDNAVENILLSNAFNFDYMMNKLGKPVDKDEWYMTPQTVNAYYSSSQNEIVFPAGILQPPFYDPKADAAINYGGIGAVIGHEFTHGFDDQGSKYDGEGNLSNWWSEEDRTQFDGRAKKVVKQFSLFEPLDSLFVNGELTLGENIADLGGATLAFHALEKELEGKEKPAPIDGFTYQQRFFLGWAQVWHMNMTEAELRKRIATDSHSPGEYRVLGPLSNMPEFSAAFGCQTGDAMVNPDSTKAIIW